MSGVQTRGRAALEAEQADVGDLLVGGYQDEQDGLPEDLMGVDTASDDDTNAHAPPDPTDYFAAAERTYRQVIQEQEGMDQVVQLTEDARLMMHILSQGFQTAIERTLDRSLEGVQRSIATNQREAGKRTCKR